MSNNNNDIKARASGRASSRASGRSIGLDFGTSNSVLVLADPDQAPAAVQFGGNTNFPSIMCFYLEEDHRGREQVISVAGQDAIKAHQTYGADCRLILSIKSYLANPTFKETNIYGRRYSIEDLVAVILAQVREEAEQSCGALGSSLTSGRPVNFAGFNPNEALALKRLSKAYAQVDFTDVEYAMEPLAAAYSHVRNLDKSEICLVADLGGGTSDFSLVRFHPDKDKPRTESLAHAGIGIAGDRLDYRIIQHVVTPLLGKGTQFKSFKKSLTVPSYIYNSFQSWSELSMLKGGRTLPDLHEIKQTADDPHAIGCLIHIIEHELGYQLYREVGQAKAQLSSQDNVEFKLSLSPLEVSQDISLRDFESWIEPDVKQIIATMEEMFASSNFRMENVDRVFMTGGTSFVPAIRREFETRFGAGKISGGDEFISVGAGLALLDKHRRGTGAA